MGKSAAKQLITVLGASGLLGTAVTRVLAERPVRLRLVGRRPTAVPPGARAEIDAREVDLTGPGAVAEAIAGSDVVIHLVAQISGASTWRVAATDPVAERVNVGLVHDIVEAIRRQRPEKPPLVLLAGSMSQVGRSTSARIDGSEVDQPLTTYDKQKMAAERAILAAGEEGVLRGAALRLATLYTQGLDSTDLDRGVVSAMMRRAFTGEPLTMWHDGTVNRDLLCVDDAARAFVAALDAAEAVAGRSWLIGTGVATSIAELFTTISKVVATTTGEPPVPVVSVPPAEHSVPTDLLDFVLDPSAFQRATGWAPRVALLDGLDRLATAFARGSARGAN
ncbi:dTDP-4-keto-6-deoxyhexose 4-ketoreductase [Saccharothrix tamanrassetensis]|uniref:dTDP-4-keto-6-deoxyhexose 4-ketoreductase n=1 Tax=Saccharothrix tamanrassetensis TaxID=1051531 RepID=A0A841CNQ2_9PSEU|nr:NAD-dependent epimerase/dehydratase [Saccharothrix tamanrassetensis]MBB5958543.1 dTDP-4-keto-6-deoxyhexose 4-ketoreductase [Saccharothrix tamanrassetensis]